VKDGGSAEGCLEANIRCALVLANCEIYSFPLLILLKNTRTDIPTQRFVRWLTKKKPVEVWFDILRDAKTYEEWEEAAFQLDVLLGNDLW
jgi:hypothetical protein